MSENELSKEEIESRKPVWFAFSELWLDTELSGTNIHFIATKMLDSGYSLKELRVICDSEVAPVVYSHLLALGGAWTGFDESWLTQKIIAEINKPKRWQDALLDPLRRMFSGYTGESEWLLLVLKYREIKRAREMIEL